MSDSGFLYYIFIFVPEDKNDQTEKPKQGFSVHVFIKLHRNYYIHMILVLPMLG